MSIARRVLQDTRGAPIPHIAAPSLPCSAGDLECGRKSVTLIIVNWNSGTLLAKCMEFIRKQTMRPDHIVIIDNASQDDSVATIRTHDRVAIHASDINIGFAAANNLGLAVCDTEFVALLNPDAFPMDDWLERLVASADSHSDIAMFGSRQLCQARPDVLDGIGDLYHWSGLVWRERHGMPQQEGDFVAREIFSPCAAAALYRRQALVDAGGFDEDYFCYVEDVDLGFRLRLAGHKAMYVSDAVVHHVGSATTGGKHSDFSVYHGHRNLVWTFVKDMPGILFWLLLPLHILMNLASILWFALQGRGGVIMRAKRDALLGLPKMWRKRQTIQSTRIATVREIWRYLNKQIVPAR
jgi:GT2 family glycosyltransferase